MNAPNLADSRRIEEQPGLHCRCMSMHATWLSCFCDGSSLSGDSFMGFKNESAVSVDTFGRNLWVVIHGTRYSSRGLPHEQHLLLCTQVPQEPLAETSHADEVPVFPLSRRPECRRMRSGPHLMCCLPSIPSTGCHEVASVSRCLSLPDSLIRKH